MNVWSRLAVWMGILAFVPWAVTPGDGAQAQGEMQPTSRVVFSGKLREWVGQAAASGTRKLYLAADLAERPIILSPLTRDVDRQSKVVARLFQSSWLPFGDGLLLCPPSVAKLLGNREPLAKCSTSLAVLWASMSPSQRALIGAAPGADATTLSRPQFKTLGPVLRHAVASRPDLLKRTAVDGMGVRFRLFASSQGAAPTPQLIWDPSPGTRKSAPIVLWQRGAGGWRFVLPEPGAEPPEVSNRVSGQ